MQGEKKKPQNYAELQQPSKSTTHKQRPHGTGARRGLSLQPLTWLDHWSLELEFRLQL